MVNEEEWEKIKDAKMFKKHGLTSFYYMYPRKYVLDPINAYNIQLEYSWYHAYERSLRLIIWES